MVNLRAYHIIYSILHLLAMQVCSLMFITCNIIVRYIRQCIVFDRDMKMIHNFIVYIIATFILTSGEIAS